MRGDRFFTKLAQSMPAGRLHPAVAAFLREFLKGEKAVEYRDRWVINTQFPPYPSRAFDSMLDQMSSESGAKRLYSVTLAVTNRCAMHCWHCYNAARDEADLPLAALGELATQVQDLGAVVITLTGGEPLLRADLEDICAAFDDRSTLILGTTGYGLDANRARRLARSGVSAMGVSLDSADEQEHDQLRGHEGAFGTALEAMELADGAGIYPYFVTVARHELLENDCFYAFLEFAGRHGAREVHLLEPCPTGRLAGRDDVVLSAEERRRIVELQMEVADRDDLPILSTLTYLEGPEAFGCGAGQTYIYIDGSGELCPCNLVPLSFGNVAREPLHTLLDLMGSHFDRPRPSCIGRSLTPLAGDGPLPTPPDLSRRLCEKHLPKEHELPRFFEVRLGAVDAVGASELTAAYDDVHDDYDDFWVLRASAPVDDLVRALALKGGEQVLEAGSGTGYGTVLLAEALPSGSVTGVDLSAGMLSRAQARVDEAGHSNVTLVRGDALEKLREQRDLDLVFTSWVLGYIPLGPFFEAVYGALCPGGRLGLVVHQLGSPKRELGIFNEIVSADPSVLTRQVSFDFPRDEDHLRQELGAAGLDPRRIWDGQCIFSYETAGGALEHLLRSGAGTVFYDAIEEGARDRLRERFLELLTAKNQDHPTYDVTHDYLACVATKPS
jgi:MoaA/NifB/PqqE/SkfB family radical SAM enzyme/protein-L-isoaspartate O-methyltransferase